MFKEETNEKCPNCNIALSQTSWKELETYEGWCFVVYITYCPKCRYIHEVDAD